MSGALLAFSATAVAVRELSRAFTVFEILSLRNLAGIAILLGLVGAQPSLRAELRLRQPRLQLARNGVHFAATYAWALGVTLLPLATVFALEFSTPAWVALLAAIFLKEPMTASRAASIVLGFVGVIIVLRPGLETLRPAAFVVLGAAVGFAVTTVLTKRLTATESTFSILFWMNAMQLPLNLLGAHSAFWTRLEAQHAVPLIGVCVGGLASHWCLTNAFRHGDAIMVVPLDFLRIPLIAFLGWRLYGEPLDIWVFAGAGLIIVGVLWNLRAETRR